MATHAAATHAGRMDEIYRYQRYIYDATRKYYLLGRDRLIADLAVPARATVLEIGCGTGRNIIRVAQRYPHAHAYGLDISDAMLATARAALVRARLADRVTLVQADATQFDAQALFGRALFDRVYFSYTLSMIPNWAQALRMAVSVVAPGGALALVDFGQQERLPPAFRALLHRWLAQFDVTPVVALAPTLDMIAADVGAQARMAPLYCGYAVQATVQRP